MKRVIWLIAAILGVAIMMGGLLGAFSVLFARGDHTVDRAESETAVQVSWDTAITFDDQSGTLGNIEWSFNTRTGELSISGYGAMQDFPMESSTAWREYEESIRIVRILEGVTSIGAYAFYNCKNLRSVTVMSPLSSIGAYAFSECSSLAILTLSGNERFVDESAFLNCNHLSTVTAPTGALAALSQLAGLENLTVNGGDTIETYVLQNCRTLKRLIISDGVKTIENSAFYYCSNLETVYIPSSVTDIAYFAFCNCQSLTTVYYQGTPRDWNELYKGANWDLGAGDYSILYGVSFDS